MRRYAFAIAAGIAAAVLLAGNAAAERFVVVNGTRLTNPQIQQLEEAACTPIPNGRYWLQQSGMWGYEGNAQPQGYLGDCCRMQCRRPSLSERGMLFAPGELAR